MPVPAKRVFERVARQRKVSLSAVFVAEAKRLELEEWFAQERAASAANLSKEALAEQDLWESTDDDWD
jgi:hypothetical protein